MENLDRAGEQVRVSTVGETFAAYVPKPLPPHPPIQMEGLYGLLDQASTALGRLDGVTHTLPDASLFLYMYVRKEAVLSSQIEGTQSSLSDLLLFENEEAPGAPLNDVIEVSNYVAAMEHGLKRLQEGFPLSLRLIREIHGVLLSKGRGNNKTPGEFRKSQNWIGGTRPGNAIFVPPPADQLMMALDSFEKFLHDETVKLPILVKVALAHHQFETIHPFLDGNGRVGRLLITLMLCVGGVLREPMLYLSLYFKANRRAYYDHLQLVRDTGDWEEWLRFFLTAVVETATQATATASRIMDLFAADRRKIENLGKSASRALRVHQAFSLKPISAAKVIAATHGMSLPPVLKGIEDLVGLGIVREITGKQRYRIFAYDAFMELLNAGTEPISIG